LTAIPEDGNPVMDECVGGVCLAREPEPNQKQELAISAGSIAHRLCVVECNVTNSHRFSTLSKPGF